MRNPRQGKQNVQSPHLQRDQLGRTTQRGAHFLQRLLLLLLLLRPRRSDVDDSRAVDLAPFGEPLRHRAVEVPPRDGARRREVEAGLAAAGISAREDGLDQRDVQSRRIVDVAYRPGLCVWRVCVSGE